MKRILFIITLFVTQIIVVAQTPIPIGNSGEEVIFDDEKSQYLGKSFVVIKELRLTHGFSFKASENNEFYAKVYEQHNNIPPSINEHFIRKEEILIDGVLTETDIVTLANQDKVISYSYFNNEGQPIQSSIVGASNSQKDIVSYYEYDEFGRQVKNYLPYVANSTDGRIHPNALADLTSFYSPTSHGKFNNGIKTDINPYSETEYENSAFNRPLQIGSVGEAWEINEVNPNQAKTTKMEYEMNTATNIAKWRVVKSQGERYFFSTTENYQAGFLYKNKIRDAEGKIFISYSNALGQKIYTKQSIVEAPDISNNSHWIETYNIYDFRGKLRFIIPNSLVKSLTTYNSSIEDIKIELIEKFAFEYIYDARGRLTKYRSPGMESEKYHCYFYDTHDRLILEQTPLQSSTNAFTFYKYDFYNRMIMSGEIIDSRSIANIQGDIDASSTSYEAPYSGFEIGYTLDYMFPIVSVSEIYNIYYFDDYDFKSNIGLSVSFNFSQVNDYPASDESNLQGYLTGGRSRIFNTEEEVAWRTNVLYYDSKGRMVQSVTNDYYGNNLRLSNAYFGLTDRITKSITDNNSDTYEEKFEYDHAGKLVNVTLTEPAIRLANYKYNELGQVIEQNLHSTNNGVSYLQSVDFRYNIRGWLSSINNSKLNSDGIHNNDFNDLFGMNFYYDETAPAIASQPVEPRFNGNLSAVVWQSKNLLEPSKEHYYVFDYTENDWLKQAKYAAHDGSSYSGNNNAYSADYVYNDNGTINSIARKGLIEGSVNTIDNISFEYKPNLVGFENELIAVTDNSSFAQFGAKDVGFTESTSSPGVTEYEYDDQGNMKYDLNKEITGIEYNRYLNLPEKIIFMNGLEIEYFYDADGLKMREEVSQNGQLITYTDYSANWRFVNGHLADITTPYGRLVSDGINKYHEYYLKDQQGNTRVGFGMLPKSKEYLATMETELESEESQQFEVYAVSGRLAIYNHTTPNSKVINPDESFTRNGNTGKVIIGKQFKVKSGDEIVSRIFMRYNGSNSTGNDIVSSILGAAATAFGLSPGGETGTFYTAFENTLAPFIDAESPANDVPHSYLTYFYVGDDGYTQVGYVPMTDVAEGSWEQKEFTSIVAPGDGEMFVFASNESEWDVYFDDFFVGHYMKEAEFQVTHTANYYPYGLPFDTYYSSSVNINKNLFQGKELLRDEYGMYDFHARHYDPVLGRFSAIDPAGQFSNPYLGMGNNPINGVDPDGRIFGLTGVANAMVSGALLGGTVGAVVGLSVDEENWGYYAAGGALLGAGIGWYASSFPKIPVRTPRFDHTGRGGGAPVSNPNHKTIMGNRASGTESNYLWDNPSWGRSAPVKPIQPDLILDEVVIRSTKLPTNTMPAASSNAGISRISYAKQFKGKWKYGQIRGSGNELLFEDGLCDCSEFVLLVLKHTNNDIYNSLTDVNAHGNRMGTTSTIREGIAELGGTIRTSNPKVGDLAIWEGHVEFVERVNGESFTIFGAGGSSNVPRLLGISNGYIWLNPKYGKINTSWNGKFLGFWTP